MPTAQVQARATVRVPPESLFAFALKRRIIPFWLHLLSDWRPGETWPEIGTPYTCTVLWGGLQVTAQGRIRSHTPPQQFQMDLCSRSFNSLWCLDFQPWGQATRLVLRIEYGLDAALRQSLPPPLFHRLVHTHMECALESLQELAAYHFSPEAP